jgi:hypothetical protein
MTLIINLKILAPEFVAFEMIDEMARKHLKALARNPMFIMSPDLAALIEKLWRKRYLSSSGEICGKGVRRLIADMRHRTVRNGTAEVWHVLTDMVAENAQGMNANRIARMIRRNFARAEVQVTRPLLAIKPDFSELRSVDGKDLDSAFRGQDES